jgi:hypothetical protein
MRGRRQYVAAREIPPAVQRQIAELRGNHIVEYICSVYCASHVALYSTYQLPAPPIRALTNEPIYCHQLRIPLPNISESTGGRGHSKRASCANRR